MSLLDNLDGEIEEEEQLSVKKDLSSVQDAGDYVIVRDIECTDADGNVFEKHDELWVPKDIERDGDNKSILLTPYNWNLHFEEKGKDCFLPSAALTLNYLLKILPAAVRKRSDGEYAVINEEFKKVLDSYHDYGLGYGYHAQNSLVAYGTSEMIHYPKKEEFIYAGGDVDVNSDRESIRLSFNKSELQDGLLSEGLKNKDIERFVRQYSGVFEPEKLVDLGDYYSWLSGRDKPTRLWFPWHGKKGKNNTSTCASWVGCNSNDFNLIGNSNLDYSNAASRVQSFPPS